MKILLAALIAIPLFGQGGAPVTINNFPTAQPTKILKYDGSNNVITICYARPLGPWGLNGSTPATFSWTRSATTLTSIAVATNVGTATTSTAHGLQVGNLVTVTGATVDPDLNASYIVLTVPSSTTFTITTASVSDGTYTDAGLVLSTTAARSTQPIWAIQKFRYTGSNVGPIQWAGGSPASQTFVCDNSEVTTGPTKISYF